MPQLALDNLVRKDRFGRGNDADPGVGGEPARSRSRTHHDHLSTWRTWKTINVE